MTPLVSVPKNPKKISGEFPLRGDTPQPGIGWPAPSARGFSTIRCVGEPRPIKAFPSPHRVSAIHSHPTASSVPLQRHRPRPQSKRACEQGWQSTSIRTHRHGGVLNREESQTVRSHSKIVIHRDLGTPGAGIGISRIPESPRFTAR